MYVGGLCDWSHADVRKMAMHVSASLSETSASVVCWATLVIKATDVVVVVGLSVLGPTTTRASAAEVNDGNHREQLPSISRVRRKRDSACDTRIVLPHGEGPRQASTRFPRKLFHVVQPPNLPHTQEPIIKTCKCLGSCCASLPATPVLLRSSPDIASWVLAPIPADPVRLV